MVTPSTPMAALTPAITQWAAGCVYGVTPPSRDCTGMSKVAYDLLTTEDSAEWACNMCIAHKAIPMIKMVDKS